MPDNAEAVANWLRSKPGSFFCDDCTSAEASVTPRQQVNPIARALALSDDYERKKTTCSMCGREKLCSAFVG
jgi:hypothetical protein